MTAWNRIWRVVVPVVLIVAVLTTTMGMVCHFHHDRYSADQCTLCHLVVAPTAEGPDASHLALATPDHSVRTQTFVFGCIVNPLPSRAPPA